MAEQGVGAAGPPPTEIAEAVTGPLADAIRNAKAGLTYRWLERIVDRLQLEREEVFPTEEILDHMPLLIDAIADFVEDPAEEGTAADEVLAKAAELGEIRFRQGFSAYQVLKEFEVLGGVLLTFLRERVSELGATPSPADVVAVTHRVHRALSKVQQSTAARHIGLLEDERHDLEQRLRLVSGMVRHTLEPRVRALLDGEAAESAGTDLRARLRQLERIVEVRPSSRHRGIQVQGVVEEAVRRVRDMARGRAVDIRVGDGFPEVAVPDAEVEQCLLIYLTNGLRHCGDAGDDQWVEVSGRMDDDARELVLAVRNTGSTVAATTDITELAGDPPAEEWIGPGVGLRFARDTIAALNGRTWAEPADDPPGAIFCLALPARRSEDEEGSGTDRAEDSDAG